MEDASTVDAQRPGCSFREFQMLRQEKEKLFADCKSLAEQLTLALQQVNEADKKS